MEFRVTDEEGFPKYPADSNFDAAGNRGVLADTREWIHLELNGSRKKYRI
jgi:hypothetical protein